MSQIRRPRKFLRWDFWALLVPLVAMSPLLYLEGQGLWSRPHMQFFVLVVGIVGYFAVGGMRDRMHPEYLDSRGQIFKLANRFTKAAGSYEQAIRLDPYRRNSRLTLVEDYTAAGLPEMAASQTAILEKSESIRNE